MDPCASLEGPCSPEAALAPVPHYYFEEVLRGPQEELRVTAEKWLQLHARLGETDKANAVARAHALARDKLAEIASAASKLDLAPCGAPPAPVAPTPAPAAPTPAALADAPPAADSTGDAGP
jgi:hypothetical protein